MEPGAMSNCSESPASAQPPDPSLFPGMRSPPDRAPRQNVYCTSRALTASHPLSPGHSRGHLLRAPLPLNRHLIPFCSSRGDTSEAPAMPGCPRCARQGSVGVREPAAPSPTLPLSPGCGTGQGPAGGMYHWDCIEQFAVGVLPTS